jgi:hypothetical protein
MISRLDFIKYLNGVREEFKISNRYQLDIEEIEDKEFLLYVWNKKGNDSRYAKSILENTKNPLVKKLEYLDFKEYSAHWLIPSDLYDYFINKGKITKEGLRDIIEDFVEDSLFKRYKFSPLMFGRLHIDDLYYTKNYDKIKENYICLLMYNMDSSVINSVINFVKTAYKLDFVKKDRNKYWFKINDINELYGLAKLKGY